MKTLHFIAMLSALGCACGDGTDTDGGVRRDSAVGVDACAAQIEICGDRMDQNCDGRDQSCGDNDSDRFQACRAGDDLTQCDCDDTRAETYPGAAERCDGLDNDCNRRIDEIATCCAGCSGVASGAADSCTVEGRCDCAGEAGVAPCGAGEVCCSNGCTNVQTDMQNCGFCERACTNTADRCEAGSCRCGSTAACSFVTLCNGGSCG